MSPQVLLCSQLDMLQINRRAAYMKRPSSSVTGTSPLMTPCVSRARECCSSQASLMNATLSATTNFSKSFVSTVRGICFRDEFQGGCSPERKYSEKMFEPTLSSRESVVPAMFQHNSVWITTQVFFLKCDATSTSARTRTLMLCCLRHDHFFNSCERMTWVLLHPRCVQGGCSPERKYSEKNVGANAFVARVLFRVSFNTTAC